jgi:hypothetical protein
MSDMESQSFETSINEIRANNNAALNADYEAMPELEKGRTYPRNINRDTNEGPDWFSEKYLEYHDGETEFVPEIPDPWKINGGISSSFLVDLDDIDASIDLGEQWMVFLNIPPTTMIMIRSLLNMIVDTIEVEGYKSPIGITRIFSDYMAKNFPDDIPRTGNPPVPDIEDECVMMGDMIEIYFKQFQSGLKSRKNFANYNRWVSRRSTYNNWSKFSTLMVDLANDLGPYSHSLLNTVVDKIDGILAHQHLNSENNVVNINEYSTSARKWAVTMFSRPPVYKILRGKPVCLKRGEPAPVDIILTAIMPKIIAREAAEQLEADAEFVVPVPMQQEEMTLSEHELDSGIH